MAAQRDDPDSILCLYRRLIDLRGTEPALEIGSYATVPATDNLLVYLREHGTGRFLVALNLGSKRETIDLGSSGPRGEVTVGTHREREGEAVEDRIELRANEGIVVRLS